MLRDLFTIALDSMRHRHIRAWLTTVGVVIGIAAIVSLLSLGQGLQNALDAQFAMIGIERIVVMPGANTPPGAVMTGLTTDDADTLESIPGTKYVTYMTYKMARYEYKGEEQYLQLTGIPGDALETAWGDIDINVKEGRFINEKDKYAANIGTLVADDIFDTPVRAHSKLYINDVPFEVVGIFEEIGNPQDDANVMIPVETYWEIFPDEEDEIATIMLQAKPGVDIPFLAEKVKRELKDARDDENFQVVTMSQYMEQISAIVGIVNLFVAAIAAISLIVGAIGIMNTMYTSILERTDEIGVMKSIGAQNKDILTLFMIEAGTMGLIGGVVGSLVGAGMAFAVGIAAEASNFQLLKVMISPYLLIAASLFAFAVGVVSGYLPAKKAAKLNPVDALASGF